MWNPDNGIVSWHNLLPSSAGSLCSTLLLHQLTRSTPNLKLCTCVLFTWNVFSDVGRTYCLCFFKSLFIYHLLMSPSQGILFITAAFLTVFPTPLTFFFLSIYHLLLYYMTTFFVVSFVSNPFPISPNRHIFSFYNIVCFVVDSIKECWMNEWAPWWDSRFLFNFIYYFWGDSFILEHGRTGQRESKT